MASILPLIVYVFFMAATSEALRCYVGGPTINNGSLLVPLQECPMLGAYSCTKTLDLSTNLVTRQCSPTNCTQNGVVMTTSICYNTTVGVSYQTNCCCYGDGCNSAPSVTNSVTIMITVAALAFWALFATLVARLFVSTVGFSYLLQQLPGYC